MKLKFDALRACWHLELPTVYGFSVRGGTLFTIWIYMEGFPAMVLLFVMVSLHLLSECLSVSECLNVFGFFSTYFNS